MTAANSPNILTTLAVAAASEVLPISGLQTTTWSGLTVQGNDVLVMYTFNGDANMDGRINADDYFQIDVHYPHNATDRG